MALTVLASVAMLVAASLAGGGHRSAPAENPTRQPVGLTPPLAPAESDAPPLPKLSLVRGEPGGGKALARLRNL